MSDNQSLHYKRAIISFSFPLRSARTYKYDNDYNDDNDDDTMTMTATATTTVAAQSALG